MPMHPVAVDIDEPCDECGNHTLQRVKTAGYAITECRLCGHLAGDPEAVEHLENLREAEARGVDPVMFGLCRLLDGIHGVRTFESFPGDAEMMASPYVKFRVGQDLEWVLERLVMSLAMINRETSAVWHLEVVFQDHHTAFSLKPKYPRDLRDHTPAWIEGTRRDVMMVTQALKSHLRLAMWQRG